MPALTPMYTPSMKTPTVGSIEGIELLMPRPRIEKLAYPGIVPMSSICTLGML